MYRPAVHFFVMAKKEKFIGIRVSESEYNRLKEIAADTPYGRHENGTVNLSGYMRNQVFSVAGIRNAALTSNVKELKYEIRKLGVNVNQIARKMNAGIGTERDINVLHKKMGEIEQLLSHYIEQMEEIWQSLSS